MILNKRKGKVWKARASKDLVEIKPKFLINIYLVIIAWIGNLHNSYNIVLNL